MELTLPPLYKRTTVVLLLKDNTIFTIVSGEYVVSLFLSCCSKDLKWQISVTAQLQLRIIFSKQSRVYPGGVRVDRPQRRGLSPFGLPLFIHFFSFPLSLAFTNWASQVGACLLHLKFSLRSTNFLLIYFQGLFPFFVFSHHHVGLLSPIQTT